MTKHKIMSDVPKPGIARLIIRLFGLVLLAGCQYAPSTHPIPTPYSSRAAGISHNINFVEIWRYQAELGEGSFLSPGMFIEDGYVLFSINTALESSSLCGHDVLVALSLQNGQEIWRTPLQSERDCGIRTAIWDTEKIYVTYNYGVYAFDIKTGKQIWQAPVLDEHTSYAFRPWDSTSPLRLNESTGKVLVLDPTTGELISKEPTGGEWLQHGQVVFKTEVGRLVAYDTSSGEALWSRAEENGIAPDDHMSLWPSFFDQDVIFRAGRQIYRIIRANINTGEVAWKTDQIYLSNFALGHSKRLYVLREDNVLAVLDPDTGQTVAYLSLSGPNPQKGWVYWVAVQEPYVLLYAKDTREIIAFKMSPQGFHETHVIQFRVR